MSVNVFQVCIKPSPLSVNYANQLLFMVLVMQGEAVQVTAMHARATRERHIIIPARLIPLVRMCVKGDGGDPPPQASCSSR